MKLDHISLLYILGALIGTLLVGWLYSISSGGCGDFVFKCPFVDNVRIGLTESIKKVFF